MRMFEAIVCGVAALGIAGVAYYGGSAVQSDRDKDAYQHIGTYAFVRGACGADLSNCNGDITLGTGSALSGESSMPYHVAHGAVFERNATGQQATIPVLLPAPCTGVNAVEGTFCKFEADKAPTS